MDARGPNSTIAIESTTGDVRVGGAMPVDPMIFDTLYLTAVQAIEITAAGDLLIGATATLQTTAETTDEPDITLTAGGGIEMAGQIEARHAVAISAGTDVLVTGGISVAHSTIEVLAGTGAAGQGGITIRREPEGTLTGVLKALGEGGYILLRAGANLGDISLLDADLETDTLTLEVPAGAITQPAGEIPEGEATPSTIGLIAAASLTATVHTGITLENTALAQVSATVTGTGDIVLRNVGFATSSAGGLPIRPLDVTLTDIETADGAITLEVIARTLNVVSVASLTDADDHDIALTVMAADADGAAVTLHDVHAAGAGDITLAVEGTITQPDGCLIADLATISAFGAVSLRTQVNSLDIEIAGEGDLTVNNSRIGALILQSVEVTNGNIHVTTLGDLTAENVVVLTDWNTNREPPSANVITLESGGTLTVVHVSGGTYAATEEEAAQIRLDLLNAALSGIDTLGIPRVFITRGTDAQGHAIEYVELTLTEAEDLASIVEDSLTGMIDPSVVDQTAFDTMGLNLLNDRLKIIDTTGIPLHSSRADRWS